MELGSRKVIVMVLIVLVIIFISINISNLYKLSISNISNIKISTLNNDCEQGYCFIKRCNENQGDDCSEKEKKDWIELLNYKKNCDKFESDIIKDEFYKGCKNTQLYKKIKEVIDGKINSQDSSNNFLSVIEEKYSRILKASIEIKTTGFKKDLIMNYDGIQWVVDDSILWVRTNSIIDLKKSLEGKTSYEGLNILKEFIKTPQKDIQEIIVKLNDFEVELDYNFKNQEITDTFYRYQKEGVIIKKSKGKDPFITGGSYKLINLNCKEIKLEKNGDELILYNYDLICQNFNIFNSRHLEFDTIEKYLSDINKKSQSLPGKVKVTINNLKSYNINNVLALNFIIEESIKSQINPYLVISLISQESKGDYKSISSTGCVGLFQFCYNTAFKDSRFNTIFGNSGLLCKGKTYEECKNDPRFDPKKATLAGIKYIKSLSKVFNGDIELILTGYNAGSSIATKCVDLENKDKLNCIQDKVRNYYKGEEKVIQVTNYINNINSYLESFA